MKVVYIASPYTVGDVAANVKRQIDIASHLMNRGFCPIAPLLSHFIQIQHPRPYENWIEIDFELVRRCDVVLHLRGVSDGADREVAFAKKIGKPVVYAIHDISTNGGESQ